MKNKYLIITGDLNWNQEDRDDFTEIIENKFKDHFNTVIVFTKKKGISFQVLGKFSLISWVNTLVIYVKYIWK